MKYNQKVHRRRSIRLVHYDYSQDGAYFVTICTKLKKHLFGEIREGEMILNDVGRIAERCWFAIPEHFPFIELDEFIVMPNHMHGIFFIKNECVGANNHSPVQNSYKSVEANNHLPIQSGTSKTVGSVIRGYKIGVTKWCKLNTDIQNVWHRNYYEHIIRNEESLGRIRGYIKFNPKNWRKDTLF